MGYISIFPSDKLTDETKWGVYFSITLLRLVILMNSFPYSLYGIVLCLVAVSPDSQLPCCYLTLSGKKKYPINYDLKYRG